MNPRLAALQRQRELVREHLQWLDAEIAAERARPGADPGAPAPPPTPLESPPPFVTAPTEATDSAANLPLPEPDTKGLHHEVRQGCLLYLVIAVGVIGALLAFIYWKY